MNLETTVKKIEEILELLGMFDSKRKPLIKRKVRVVINDIINVHIIIGFHEVGMYTIKEVEEDIYFTGWDTSTEDNNVIVYSFDILSHLRAKDFRVMTGITFLKKINKYFELSKPAKKDLEGYVNDSFKLIDGKVIDMTSPEERWSEEGGGENVLPRREDLLNQKVYLYAKDPCTNSMLMSRDLDMLPKTLNRLIHEVIAMNPHLAKYLHVDYYEDESVVANGGEVLVVSATSADDSQEEVLVPIGTSTKTTKERYFQYYTLDEPLYMEVVNSIPKSPNIKVLYKRKKIISDYFRAFTNLKSNMYASGHSTAEVKEASLKRKGATKGLMRAVNEVLIDKPNIVRAHLKGLFNHINHKMDIHAIKKDPINRNMDSKPLQVSLELIELKLKDVMQECVKQRFNPLAIAGVATLYLDTMHLPSLVGEDIETFVSNEIQTSLRNKGSIKKYVKAIEDNPYLIKPLSNYID